MANEVNVERCDGQVVPKRWKVTFEGKQAGWVEELIISTIFGTPEYVGMFFKAEGHGVNLLPKTFGGPTGQQLAINAVIEAWQRDKAETLQSEAYQQFQRETDCQQEVEDFGGGVTG